MAIVSEKPSRIGVRRFPITPGPFTGPPRQDCADQRHSITTLHNRSSRVRRAPTVPDMGGAIDDKSPIATGFLFSAPTCPRVVGLCEIPFV